MQISRPHRIAA